MHHLFAPSSLTPSPQDTPAAAALLIIAASLLLLPPPPPLLLLLLLLQVSDANKGAAGDIFAFAGVYDGHGAQGGAGGAGRGGDWADQGIDHRAARQLLVPTKTRDVMVIWTRKQLGSRIWCRGVWGGGLLAT